jgi:hypothetical protein
MVTIHLGGEWMGCYGWVDKLVGEQINEWNVKRFCW